MSDSLKIRFVFLCGLRGYYQYRTIWTPSLHEVLEAKQESGNRHDRVWPSLLLDISPKELSRFTYYIILHGAKVTAIVMDTHHRRSPLVQGGLEIPIQVTVEMDLTEKSRQCLDKYETLVDKTTKNQWMGSMKTQQTLSYKDWKTQKMIRTRSLTLT